MDFLYTIDPNAEEPIMLIDRHIGWDDDEGEGIMGDKFCRELMFLDTLNKSKIKIWINSPGGRITDSDQIVSAILKSKTKVDTHNIGMAASCAGAIFLAGRNRYMMDYAKFMIHGISGANNNGQSKAFSDGIVTNLTTRCHLDETTARQFMSTETWLNADQCEQYGIAVKEASSEYNRPRKSVQNNIDGWKDLKGVVNRLVQTKKNKTVKMTSVTNKLKLNESANESAILSAITDIENRAISAESKLQASEVENKAKIEALNKQIETLTTDKAGLEAKVTTLEAEKKAKVESDNKAEKKSLVEAAAKLGKIENKAEAIDAFLVKFEKMEVADLKNMLDAIPAKVKGADLGGAGDGKPKTYTAQDINNSLLDKLNSRK